MSPQPRETPAPALDPDGLPPLFDVGNTLLARVPSNLVIGQVPTPEGKMGVATIRTQSVTLTLLLTAADAGDWRDTFAELAKSLGGNALVLPTVGESMTIARQALDGKPG